MRHVLLAASPARPFPIKVSPRAVKAYDPTKVAGQNLSAKLREHFYRVRESFPPRSRRTSRSASKASGCAASTR